MEELESLASIRWERGEEFYSRFLWSQHWLRSLCGQRNHQDLDTSIPFLQLKTKHFHPHVNRERARDTHTPERPWLIHTSLNPTQTRDPSVKCKMVSIRALCPTSDDTIRADQKGWHTWRHRTFYRRVQAISGQGNPIWLSRWMSSKLVVSCTSLGSPLLTSLYTSMVLVWISPCQWCSR